MITPPLAQSWPRPSRPRPIVVVGAGSIVDDAHLPAYRLAGFPVAGVLDRDRERARAIGAKWDVPVIADLDAALAIENAVFDLALPPAAHVGVLARLPVGAPVLIQKPMGADLAEASRILAVCEARRLVAAVNFQLRFAPMMLAVADAVRRGLLGRLVDVEVHLNLLTPWHLFAFLKGAERVELSLHSIHYLDLIRSLLGEPVGVHCRSLGRAGSPVAQTRTSAILDFGDDVRCTLSINHDHGFGRRFQDAGFRFEGERGAAMVKLGLLLDYPRGEPDELWIATGGKDWEEVPLEGGWFPHAFVGVMSNLMRFADGEDAALSTAVADAWRTMALVEACYRSAAAPATPVPDRP